MTGLQKAHQVVCKYPSQTKLQKLWNYKDILCHTQCFVLLEHLDCFFITHRAVVVLVDAELSSHVSSHVHNLVLASHLLTCPASDYVHLNAVTRCFRSWTHADAQKLASRIVELWLCCNIHRSPARETFGHWATFNFFKAGNSAIKARPKSEMATPLKSRLDRLGISLIAVRPALLRPKQQLTFSTCLK